MILWSYFTVRKNVNWVWHVFTPFHLSLIHSIISLYFSQGYFQPLFTLWPYHVSTWERKRATAKVMGLRKSDPADNCNSDERKEGQKVNERSLIPTFCWCQERAKNQLGSCSWKSVKKKVDLFLLWPQLFSPLSSRLKSPVESPAASSLKWWWRWCSLMSLERPGNRYVMWKNQ